MLLTAAAVTLIVASIGWLFCAFMFIRNTWVYKTQMKFHNEAFDRRRSATEWFALGGPCGGDLCKSYNYMMWHFWIWNSEKFRTKSLPPIRI